MPKTTTTTVSKSSNDQYQVTIPKALGDALDLEGKQVTWDVASGKALRMEIHEE